MRIKTVYLVVLLLVATRYSGVLAQRPAPPPKPVPRIESTDDKSDDFLGTLSGNIYSNRFFRLTLTIPDDYVILNRAEISVFSKAGADMFKGGNIRNDKAFEDAVNNSVPLIMVAQKPPGSVGNAVFDVQVRKQSTGVAANMVLAESIKLMTGTSKSVLSESLRNTKFGSKVFVGVEFDTELVGQKLKQRLFVTMHRGYALTIGLTYTTKESFSAFDDMLKGMTFDPK